MNIIIILISISIIYTVVNSSFEHFLPLHDEYSNRKIKYQIKEDSYMNFLVNLNNNFKTQIQSVGGKAALCNINVKNTIEKKALKNSFKNIPINTIKSDIYIEDNIENLNKSLDNCVYKANTLSEVTDPKLYLTSGQIYFPPKWIGPYKNTQLPKKTNLKRWNNLYNCCKA